jgi:hypothetical protein
VLIAGTEAPTLRLKFGLLVVLVLLAGAKIQESGRWVQAGEANGTAILS